MTQAAINDFAVRSFRDIADGDYIAARMACRAELVPQFLWASQQAIEKYLKCILLLNRIRAKSVRHNLAAGMDAINQSGKLTLALTERSREFIAYLNDYGTFRYLEVSYWSEGSKIVDLDQAIWELRRFCTLDPTPRRRQLEDGRPAPRVHLPGGHLESILKSTKRPNAARNALLWQNAFFGRPRRTVRVGGWMKSVNAPLPLRPEIFREVDEYVFLPNEIRKYWKERKEPKEQ